MKMPQIIYQAIATSLVNDYKEGTMKVECVNLLTSSTVPKAIML